METPELAPRTVDVWLLWHQKAESDMHSLLPLLSAEEQSRASRFINQRARYEFCLTRSALRQLLASYGIGSADAIQFEYEKHGKPKLASGSNKHLHFNVAHTRELSAFAVTDGEIVGIDVEYQRNVSDADRIVESKFAMEEQQTFLQTPEEDRKQVFFRGWTRKEAFIKATGEGLCRPLSSFAVTIDSDSHARFLRIDDGDPVRWSLFNLSVGKHHAGALAVKCDRAKIVCQELDWRRLS